MTIRSASARTQVWLQTETDRVAASSGERFGHFGRSVVDQQGEQEMRGDPRPGEVLVLGRKAVETQDRFQSFEGEFDLPADAVEHGQRLGRKGLGLERGDEDQIACGVERAGIDRPLILAGVVARSRAGRFSHLWRFRQNDQTQRQRREPTARLVDRDAPIDFAVLGGGGEQGRPIEPPSALVHKVEAVPGQPDQHIGPRPAGLA